MKMQGDGEQYRREPNTGHAEVLLPADQFSHLSFTA